MMSDDRDAILAAEEFIREAASELKLMQERSSALAKARHSLEDASKTLAAATTAFGESATANEEIASQLRETVGNVEQRISAAVDSELAGLNQRIEQSVVQLQRQVLESERIRREMLEESLKASRRSLLDSAQQLSETAAGLSSNAGIAGELAASEREQWRFTLVNSLAEAHGKLQSAGEAASSLEAQFAAGTSKALSRIETAVSTIESRVSEVNSIAARMRAKESTPKKEAPAEEIVRLRKLVMISAIAQLALLVGTVAFLVLR
jgi:hypothetical protein